MKRSFALGAIISVAAGLFAQEVPGPAPGLKLRAGYADIASSGYYEHDEDSSDLEYRSEGWTGSVTTVEVAWVAEGWEVFASIQSERLRHGDERRVSIPKVKAGAEWNALRLSTWRGLHAGAGLGFAFPLSDFPEADGRTRRGIPYPTFETVAGYRFPIADGWRLGTDLFLAAEFLKRAYEEDGAAGGDPDVWGGYEFGLAVTFEYSPGRRSKSGLLATGAEESR
jgi:hypothetical protein